MPVDDGQRLLGLADLEPVPHADHALGGAYGDDVRGDEQQGVVGHLDGGGVADVHLGTAVDDDDVVAGAQGADDLAGDPVGDLLAAFALGGGEEQAECRCRG